MTLLVGDVLGNHTSDWLSFGFMLIHIIHALQTPFLSVSCILSFPCQSIVNLLPVSSLCLCHVLVNDILRPQYSIIDLVLRWINHSSVLAEPGHHIYSYFLPRKSLPHRFSSSSAAAFIPNIADPRQTADSM